MDLSEEVIWKESFFKENFNVDQCLSKYTLKSDLETLRNDLKDYGDELHYQMAEILKTETEAIVNLAEYLTNLNSKIDDLSVPVSQLREEIKTLYTLIKTAKDAFGATLDNIKSCNNQRNYLNLKLAIFSSSLYIDRLLNNHNFDSTVIQRAVNKHTFDYNYLAVYELPSDVHEVNLIGAKLTGLVNEIFLKSLESNDEEVILRCFRMYDNLAQTAEAEKTYQIHVVRPALKHLFTENYLENCQQNLSLIYDEAFEFIDEKLSPLLEILKLYEFILVSLKFIEQKRPSARILVLNAEPQCPHPELKSFNFIMNSFWVEVDKLLRENLPHVTAPGNPELFQKRFIDTWSFLCKIASKCGDERLIHSHELFQNHVKRFNLPVYFEIRFQQIAGSFESDVILSSQEDPGENEIKCRLKITLSLWRALARTFDKEVYIYNLSDQFLKLSMLLLSRYLRWFEQTLKDYKSGDAALESYIINSISDLVTVKKLIGDSSAATTIFRIIPDKLLPIVQQTIALNAKIIDESIQKLQNHLVTSKTNEGYKQLLNVAAIPRLYRRTNRGAPKEASGYMVEAVQPILQFYEKYEQSQGVQIILDSVIANNTRQFSTLVDDVLKSVCRTEESLRRLKNRNSPQADATHDEHSDKVSDEVKIREQIKLDVCYFSDKLAAIAYQDTKELLERLKCDTS